MVQPEYANEANYTKRTISPMLRYYFRWAQNQRVNKGVAKATVETNLGTRDPQLASAEKTEIMDDVTA